MDNRFPVIDITHQPKRTQRDNLLRAKGEAIPDSSTDVVADTPSVFTLERAIAFYENLASAPQGGRFYAQTATWLRELLLVHKNSVVSTDAKD